MNTNVESTGEQSWTMDLSKLSESRPGEPFEPRPGLPMLGESSAAAG
jgi:hypothetical protein